MIIGKKVILREPSLADYVFVKTIWEDEETMRAVGGPHPLTLDKYKSWYKTYFVDQKTKHRYYLIIDKQNKECLGEVSFHILDSKTRTAELNIKVMYKHRIK